jgi:hypothetical protein
LHDHSTSWDNPRYREANAKNRNFAHMTPKLARDSSCLLVRLRGVSGFTIRKQGV